MSKLGQLRMKEELCVSRMKKARIYSMLPYGVTWVIKLRE